MSVPISLRYY